MWIRNVIQERETEGEKLRGGMKEEKGTANVLQIKIRN